MEKKKAKLDSCPFDNEDNMFSQAYPNHALYWIKLFDEDTTINKDLKCPSKIQINDTKLGKELFTYFSNVVPTLLRESKIGGVLRYSTDENKFEKLIAKELEYFICNSYSTNEVLQEFSNPSKFCGKVFGLGDPTYTCK